MKKCFMLLGALLLNCLALYSAEGALDQAKSPRKKIAIAWSKGGGAHKSMLDALKTYFADSYDLMEFCPFEVGWGGLDPVRKLTFHYMDGEDLYNYLLANDMPWLINKMHCCGLTSLKRHRKYIQKQLADYISKDKPDLIISVIPILNSALADVSVQLKIPFLLIAPDINIRTYFTEKLPVDNFYCTIPFSDEFCWKTAIRCGVDPHTIMTTGFPLRLDFFEPKDRPAIRKQFEIPAGKPIVMILMGGVGSSKVVKYVRKIIKMDKACHLIVCIGKKESIRRTLERMKKSGKVSLSIIGFTRQISDLMAVSDVLISKPGATSLSEAIQMELPVILDNTSTTLEVELLHLDFIKKNKLGVVVNKFSELESALDFMLNTDNNHGIRQRMKKFGHADFPKKIKDILCHIFDHQEMCPKQTNRARV